MTPQPYETRKAQAELRAAHHEAQQPALEAEEQRQAEVAEFAALDPAEKADLTRRRRLGALREHEKREQKAEKANVETAEALDHRKHLAEPEENKALIPDLEDKSKDELAALSEERGLEVTRADGKDGDPLKSDYLRALKGA